MHSIISELCKIPSARDEFQLGDGVWIDNHAIALNEVEIEGDESPADDPSTSWPSKPDQFCIHRVDSDTNTLLTTVEYKPPRKLSAETLRAGLQPIDFYHKIVESDTIPSGGPEKLKYNAMRLAGSAIVQEYHVMIQEELEYSYLTTGLAHVQLRVPFDDPSILYYNLCEPNLDVAAGGFQGPKTEIERVLCLCLMSFHSHLRGQAWRNDAQAWLPTWTTSFDHTRSQIPKQELRQTPPDSDYDTTAEYPSSEISTSLYQPSSSPAESPGAQGRRIRTRSLASCAPSDVVHRENSSDSDSDPAAYAGRKRGFSQITSSPPTQQPTSTFQKNPKKTEGGQSDRHDNEFCTQRCLLGLQQGGTLDACCPNVELHQSGGHGQQHPISTEELVKMLKKQLDETLDHNCPNGGLWIIRGAIQNHLRHKWLYRSW